MMIRNFIRLVLEITRLQTNVLGFSIQLQKTLPPFNLSTSNAFCKKTQINQIWLFCMQQGTVWE